MAIRVGVLKITIFPMRPLDNGALKTPFDARLNGLLD